MATESKIIVEEKETYGALRKENPEEDIDEIFEKSGPFGCFQVLIQITTFYLFLITVYNFVLSFFTGSDPPWKCVTRNSTFCKLHYNEVIVSDSDMFTERCDLHRNEWTYVTGKNYSFVTEFDLICEKTSIAALISSSYYIGGVLGAIVAGTIADIYGRIYVLLFSTLFTTCSSIGSSYVTSIWQLFGLNIVRGAGSVGCYYTTIVYQSEFSAPSYRSITMNILLFGGTASFLLVDLIANYVSNWRHLSTYAALPSIPVVVALFFMPESPRWLLAIGKKARAEKIMYKIRTFSINPTVVAIRLKSPSCYKEKTYTYLDLVRNFKLLKLTAAIISVWFVLPVVYYSIALQSSNLGGNMYEAFALSTTADIPAYVFSAFLSNKIGRKKTNLGGLFISGIIMGAMVLIPRDLPCRFTINIIMAFTARFSNCIAFCGMYTWSFEMFPTILRSQGLSLCAIFDRLGMLVVPFITRVLQSASHYMPFIIMFVFAVVASLIGLLLPETNGKPTRETYEDFFDTPTLEAKNVDLEVIENANVSLSR